jgi:uncharacterized protein YndB with AHSA1/START domain
MENIVEAGKKVIVQRSFDAPIELVWRAITEKELMKQWYFDLEAFKAEVGFKFEFKGGPSPEKQYLHDCEITEVIKEKKLTYTWSFRGYEGVSYLTFELFPDGEKTKLVLTHTGIESFPSDNPNFAIHNYEAGWNHVINKLLKAFLEPAN